MSALHGSYYRYQRGCRCSECSAANTEYWRKRRAARKQSGVKCAADGCENPVGQWKYCPGHETRYRKTGSLGDLPVKPYFTDDIQYGGAHDRVRKARGKASEQACVDCSGPAAQWSLRKDAARVMYQETGPLKGMAYSPSPDDYDPRCAPCHMVYDDHPFMSSPSISRSF